MPTKKIITLDNTKLSNYRRCPRFFLLARHLGWVGIEQKPALVFGGAMHEGMAFILRNYKEMDKDELLIKACDAFDIEWVTRGYPLDDSLFFDQIAPRIPGNAHEMLQNWYEQYQGWLSQIEVIEVEQPFAIRLFPKFTCPYCDHVHEKTYWEDNTNCAKCNALLTELFIVGRRDATYKYQGSIWCLEHKTSSMYKKDGGFMASFVNSFRLDSQVDSYTYTAKLVFGPTVQGVTINALSTNKYAKNKVFNQYAQSRTDEALFAWYREACYWSSHLLRDLEIGPEVFHRNMEGCQNQYGFCEYQDICRFYQSPWELEYPPIGYKVEFWEPFNQEELQEILSGV